MTTDPAPHDLISAADSNVGAVRKVNEDSYLSQPAKRLWAVADGMGGHQAGDVASRLIVEALDQATLSDDEAGLIDDLRDALSVANGRIMAEAARRGPGIVIGSTAVVLAIRGDRFVCLWAGDSRLYRFRDGVLQQLTRDHSHVQDLVDAGLITAEQSERHPQANMITRAVGTQDILSADQIADQVLSGDLLLLATDGLSRMVDAGAIADLLARTPLADLPAALIGAALAEGGKDNVTVVAVQAPTGPMA